MRQIFFDEISPADIKKIHAWLRANGTESSIDGLYWISLAPDLLTADQLQATGDQPFCWAIEIGPSWAKFELLIRSRLNMRSPATRYASPDQQSFILDFANRLVTELKITT